MRGRIVLDTASKTTFNVCISSYFFSVTVARPYDESTAAGTLVSGSRSVAMIIFHTLPRQVSRL